MLGGAIHGGEWGVRSVGIQLIPNPLRTKSSENICELYFTASGLNCTLPPFPTSLWLHWPPGKGGVEGGIQEGVGGSLSESCGTCRNCL